ncbi:MULTISPECIES: tetratricopeptide repeat protein [Chitinibacter]|uniref:tetratricopeptide repeat protein n=1 Tax=Chitinibacter TaxID=230666 RepID=UPI00040654C7|nr:MULTISPECIES: tetratricopeptide repeat protein [Chitinibacter]
MTRTVQNADQRLRDIQRLLHSAPEQALQLSEQLLRESQQIGDMASLVQATVFIANTHNQLGVRCDDQQRLLEALMICQHHDLPHLAMDVLERLGRDYYTGGLYAESLAAWKQCIEVCRTLRHCGPTHADALIGLGHVCSAYNAYEQAVEFHRAALQLLRLNPQLQQQAKAQLSLGWDLYHAGQMGEAINTLQACADFSQANGLQHFVSECLLHLGTIALKSYHLDQAELYLTQALESIEQTPAHWTECNVLGQLAEVHFLLGNPRMSLDIIERALRLARQDGMRHIEARFHAQASGYCAALKDHDGVGFYAQQLDQIHLENSKSWHIPAIDLSDIRQYLPKKA